MGNRFTLGILTLAYIGNTCLTDDMLKAFLFSYSILVDICFKNVFEDANKIIIVNDSFKE